MDINRLINGFLGSDAGKAVAMTAGDVTGAAKNAVSGVTGSGTGSGFGGGLAGGALAGGAMALLLGNKKARKLGGKALTYGGVAALGGLAYMAYRNYKTVQSGAPQASTQQPTPVPDVRQIEAPPADSGFDPAGPDAKGGEFRLGLIQAMIAAAKADGHIDAQEQAAINEQIAALNLSSAEKGFLFDAMQAESDPLSIAALAKDEAQAAELYLASLLAMDPDTPEEQRYLERLGDALRLPMALRTELARHAGAAKENAQAF